MLLTPLARNASALGIIKVEVEVKNTEICADLCSVNGLNIYIECPMSAVIKKHSIS